MSRLEGMEGRARKIADGLAFYAAPREDVKKALLRFAKSEIRRADREGYERGLKSAANECGACCHWKVWRLVEEPRVKGPTLSLPKSKRHDTKDKRGKRK